MKVGSPSLRLFRFGNQCLYKSSPRWKGITDVFSYYIAKDMQHLNIVDDKGFRHLLHNIEPLHNCRVNIRARRHIQSNGVKLCIKARKVLLT